jgi:hypothetical protein
MAVPECIFASAAARNVPSREPPQLPSQFKVLAYLLWHVIADIKKIASCAECAN